MGVGIRIIRSAVVLMFLLLVQVIPVSNENFTAVVPLDLFAFIPELGDIFWYTQS
jgi:hypothetical protein